MLSCKSYVWIGLRKASDETLDTEQMWNFYCRWTDGIFASFSDIWIGLKNLVPEEGFWVNFVNL